jgi:hypothetical protein
MLAADVVMTEIARLASRRGDCFKLPMLEVKIGSDLVGDMTTSYLLQADVVKATWQNGEIVYLPIARLQSPERATTITTSYAASKGIRPLPSVSFERLSDFHAGATNNDMRSEVLAYLPKSDLEKGAELHISHRIEPCAPASKSGWRSFIFDVFDPTGLLDLTFSRSEPLSSLRFDLPDDINTTDALLTIRTDIDETLDQLIFVRDEIHSDSPEPNLAMALRQVVPTVHLMDDLIDKLELLARQLDFAKGLTPESRGVPAAVKDLKSASYPLRRVLDSSSTHQEPGTSWEEIRRAISEGVSAAAPFRRIRVVSGVDRSGGIPLVTDSPGQVAVERVVMVYTTHRHTSLARIGTPAALLVMALVMAFVAWRTWYVFPLVGHDMNEAEQTSSLDASRDSIVALLILFPAILYTQLDRIDANRVAAHRAHGMTLMLLSAGLLAPVLVAALALGSPRPDLFAAAAFATSVLLAGLGSWALTVLHGASLTKRRAERLAREIKHG